MTFYLFSLLLGFAGLLIMAVSGVAGHGGDHSSHSHGGHLHGGGHHGDVGHVDLGGHVGHAHVGGHGLAHTAGHGLAHAHGAGGGLAHAHDPGGGHAHDGDQGHHGDHGADRIGAWFLSFLSPRVLFSILVGIGAAGLLLAGFLPGPLLLPAAVAGGFAFELLAVRPVWNFFFRFGSDPALTLESAVYDTATAVTGFNREGEGLVKIELDGQIVQVLARLSPGDLASGARVRAGDTLVVEEVDADRNCCTVTLPVAAAGFIRGA
jgi:hypothetical protein